ncbi:MAG: prepilin-type N-terminal cleavage/methylation domain-containing protein [Bdellovibrionia bacterium]
MKTYLFSKIRKQQSAFTIMEVMIASAILGTSSLDR